jgi:glutathionyl-hydroquinone reductase
MHTFDPVEAVKYGILEAVLLSNIRWWVAKNQANGRHNHDGRYWTYNSAKAFTKLFPYASQQQIQRALKRLEDAEVLHVGSYNSNPYDHTKWYSVAIIDSSNLINQEIKVDQPSNTDINTVVNKSKSSDPLFVEFWKAYPRKTNKDFAEKVFAKLKVDDALLTKMIQAIYAQNKTVWKDKEQQYIPHPSTWLNGKRWDDEVIAKPMSASDREKARIFG